MLDDKKLWDAVLVQIELSVSKATYVMWFKDTHIVKQEAGVVYLGVPNTFVKTWLYEKYHNTLLRLLRELDPAIRSIEYTITSSKNSQNRAKESDKKPNQEKKELPLDDFYIAREDNLNPKYTFDTFVIGPFNEMAHAAAQAIIKKPVAYNPLFIYGNTGLGKTHLMQAIGNHLKNSSSQKKIYYITSEKFSQDMVNSVQSNKMNIFKEKYRKYDVFIMDDLQFLANKEKTQEELFHLFNHLYDNNKQIIFSSDVHPNYIPNLEKRLTSRFVAGMTVDIPPPDHESRVALLRAKSQQNSIEIKEEILDFIASYLEGNVRELEGILNNILVQMEVKGKDLTISDVKGLIKNSAKTNKNLSVKDIVKVVAGFYNIEEDSIYNKTRKKEVVRPRQLTMYILREDFHISYPSIGQKLGGRDHTTVIHSCEKVKNELKMNSTIVEELSQIRSML
jgi:chromosomal replication initiator protein